MITFYEKNVGNTNYDQSDKPKYTIDLNPEHSQWFIKILDSKIAVSGYKSDIIHDSVERLYNCLMNEGYLDSLTNKDLFIYRFSGTGTPFNLGKKIKWTGKNVLLGHIIRCLTSDDKYHPEEMGIAAEFFESRTKKKMNLASARHINVSNYEDEKNDIDPNFVEAVEILKKSGFINAECTSKRR